MSFYHDEGSRFIELSAPVTREDQLALVEKMGLHLNKPNGAGGCYLLECRSLITRTYIIHWLLTDRKRVRSNAHLDKHVKSWTPVRLCDLRKH